MRSIVMLSGGLKSVTALAYAISLKGLNNVQAVTVTYPNTAARKNAGRRALAAQRIASYYKVDHTTVHFPNLPAGGQSVPTEPVILSAMGTHFAYRARAEEVLIGAQRKNNEDFVFVNNLKATIRMCFEDHAPELNFPFLSMPGAHVVRIALELGAPAAFSYSCQEGELLHCGRCQDCSDRRQSFKEAGFHDPNVYAN